MTAPTYKHKSRTITLIAFIIITLTAIAPITWPTTLSTKYWVVIQIIIGVLGYAAAQLSEEKRIKTAEAIMVEKQNIILGYPLNEDYTEPPL